MSWSKQQIIDDAFGQLALAGYEFDISPEEQQAAARRLDAMMAEWTALGISVGYNFALTPGDVVLGADSGLPLLAISAAYLRLAVRIADSKGKILTPTLRGQAQDAYDALLSFVATRDISEQQFRSTMPRGAGSKPWRTNNRPFLPKPDTSPIRGADDGGLTLGKTDP